MLSAAALVLLVVGQAETKNSAKDAQALKPTASLKQPTATNGVTPEIEFRVLLIIKAESDIYSATFLPVRNKWTDQDIARVRRCFEIETPDMVSEITDGKVRFIPTVRISDKPLRHWDDKSPKGTSNFFDEMRNEVDRTVKPGEFDTVGYCYLAQDPGSGYHIPANGLGLGWLDGDRSLGMFGAHYYPEFIPRSEIFLHEWMHGLDGFYEKKSGVKLPDGMLHGAEGHGYRPKPWRKGEDHDSNLEWYGDYLNGKVREGEELTGLGSVAWRQGPLRSEAQRKQFKPLKVKLREGNYPDWVHELMKGDLSHAVLGPPLLEKMVEPGEISRTGWKLDKWDSNAGTKSRVVESGTFVIDNPRRNSTALVRNISLEPSSNYVFTAEVRTEGVQIKEKGGQYAVNLYAGDSISTKNLSGTNSWTSIALPFTTREKADSFEVRMGLGGHGSTAVGKAFFKNVQVMRIGYPLGPTAVMTETKGKTPPVELTWREWSTADGRFKTGGRFVKSDDGKVRLQKRDGNVVDVAVDLLRDSDKKVIEAAMKYQQP